MTKYYVQTKDGFCGWFNECEPFTKRKEAEEKLEWLNKYFPKLEHRIWIMWA